MRVTLLLQARVEYVLLHYASRALYGQLLAAGVAIQEYHRSFLHAKVAVVDDRWATVGSSNIDPYSLLMAREANVFVRDPRLRRRSCAPSSTQMIDDGARPLGPQHWAGAAARCTRRWSGSPTASCASRWAFWAMAATSGFAAACAATRRRATRTPPTQVTLIARGARDDSSRLLDFDHAPRSPPLRPLPGSRARGGDWHTIRTLLPYLWAYKGRVLAAIDRAGRAPRSPTSACRC